MSTSRQREQRRQRSQAASDALEAFEEALAKSHPHLFPDELTVDSMSYSENGLVLSPKVMGEVLTWAARNPHAARALTAQLGRQAPMDGAPPGPR